MSRVNKFGLARDILEGVKREVRQRSALGCVVCGHMICDYHHTEEYNGIDSHDPSKIILLCKNHHGDVTGSTAGRRLSDENLQKYIDFPFGARKGENSWKNLNEIRAVKIGNFLFEGVETVLRIDDLDVLSFCITDDDFPIIGINAKFTDAEGKEILRIEKNNTIGNTDAWDFTFKGNELQINNSPRSMNLKIIFHNNGLLEVARLKMFYAGGYIEIMPNGYIVAKFEGKTHTITAEARVFGADIGFEISKGRIVYGKSERTIFREGISDPSRVFHSRSSRVNASEENPSQKEDNSNQPYGKFDFKGEIGSRNLSIEGMKYSRNMTAMEISNGSLAVGVSRDNSDGKPNFVSIKNMSLSLLKKVRQ